MFNDNENVNESLTNSYPNQLINSINQLVNLKTQLVNLLPSHYGEGLGVRLYFPSERAGG